MKEKKTVKAKKSPKLLPADEVKDIITSALKEDKVPEPKEVAKEATKAVKEKKDTPKATLWVKRVTKEGEVESTWRIRGNFESKKAAQEAFDKLNASGMYESRID